MTINIKDVICTGCNMPASLIEGKCEFCRIKSAPHVGLLSRLVRWIAQKVTR